jgi:branched-chain amino acid transport system substrate-binding protein
VIFVSYTSDAILYVKTMQALGYKPPIVIGDNSGFSDAAFLKNVGSLAQGAINRSAWDIGKPDSVTYKINEMYKKRTGYDLDDTAGRAMQGFFTLIEAINRAGSTDPAKIQAALKATDLKPNQLMMGYKGVKFDEKGNNVLASALLIQIQGDKYVAVWPKASATAPLQLPYKGW